MRLARESSLDLAGSGHDVALASVGRAVARSRRWLEAAEVIVLQRGELGKEENRDAAARDFLLLAISLTFFQDDPLFLS